jgi:hypothetical protein
MFQRPAIINLILGRIEKTHKVNQPDIPEVLLLLKKSPGDPRNSFALGGLLISPENEPPSALSIDPDLSIRNSLSLSGLFISPDYSPLRDLSPSPIVNLNNRPYFRARDPSETPDLSPLHTLPVEADLTAPIPAEELHAEGKKCTEVRSPLTPKQV